MHYRSAELLGRIVCNAFQARRVLVTRPSHLGIKAECHFKRSWFLQSRTIITNHSDPDPANQHEPQPGSYSEADHEHAVISTFDLFSIGIGPSSSHTVGPMRAGNIFVSDLAEAGLLQRVHKIHVSLYGSLALTGEGHMTPSALLLGLESADVETVDTAFVPSRFEQIKQEKKLFLGRELPDGNGKEISFDYSHDFRWQWGKKLALHSNGMRLTVFDEDGNMLATNDMFSVGGGFVVNGAMSTASTASATALTSSGAVDSQAMTRHDDHSTGSGHPPDLAENMFYKEIRRADAAGDRRTGPEVKPLEGSAGQGITVAPLQQEMTSKTPPEAGPGEEKPQRHPRYPFRDANSLLTLCRKHNLTIAQLVFENEKSQGYTDDEILDKIFRIWEVMDNSILEGVQAPVDSTLPGALKLHRRAPGLYSRLARGLYRGVLPATGDKDRASSTQGKATQGPHSSTALVRKGPANIRGPPRIVGSLEHPVMPSPMRRTTFPELDHLSVYAIAVNETNAAGGRIVTAPTNGAAGIIPAVLKYTIEFISDDPERDIPTFLMTAAAIGMLYKRGASISAAEGGCMAEVGVACSMAAGAFAACMGASPEIIEQAAEIGIEHNLGLTCDPIAGLVQAPCIERNALGAIKAISSANLALSSSGNQKVRLDDAIRAMRVTARGMRDEFKETSLSGLATSVPLNIPVSVPDC
ncbi:uncharacterized protein E0L32_008769 [Thyridium curvatum]|uniref:L-serine ammonia-lyase n=1 Tax=Thyridium curvatum TaxID=1093900 RepID=A0A507AV36_9PEZI|nr:uncharacterized protein E0L32_008769 [Thyridium curvatum]TPX10364.1 hypothetical protein E0L32_008769 [Thyridium curvatum]